jgi:hypothetical protein
MTRLMKLYVGCEERSEPHRSWKGVFLLNPGPGLFGAFEFQEQERSSNRGSRNEE